MKLVKTTIMRDNPNGYDFATMAVKENTYDGDGLLIKESHDFYNASQHNHGDITKCYWYLKDKNKGFEKPLKKL